MQMNFLTNKESGSNQKDKEVSKEMTLTKHHIKETMEIVHNIRNPKDKLLENNPNLESNKTNCQSIDKMFAPHKEKFKIL